MGLGLCVPHDQTPAIRLGMRYPRMAIWFVPPSPREFPVYNVVSYIPFKSSAIEIPQTPQNFFGYGYVFSAGFERSAVQLSRKSTVDAPSDQVKFTVTCLLGKGSSNLCARKTCHCKQILELQLYLS